MAGQAQESQIVEHARSLLNAGKFMDAVAVCERALRKSPRSTTLLLIQAAAQTRMGSARKAFPLIRRVIELEPKRHQAYLELGVAYQADAQLDEAAKAYEKALAMAPANPDAAAALGSLRRLQGDHEAAMAAVEGLVRGDKANAPCVLLFAEQAKRLKRQREGIEAVRAFLERDNVWAFYVRRLNWALGELLDSVGEHGEAFACYSRVNQMERVAWDADAFSAAADSMIEAWTPEAIKALPASGVESEAPVFVFGMPRSGTTLTEQIIASHPSAVGGGELALAHEFGKQLAESQGNRFALFTDLSVLNRSRLSRFARSVVKRLGDLDRSATRATDKAPNTSFFLGLIGAALPNAKLVHCLRHPLDTCLSCYFQDFRDTHAMAFTREMSWLGRYYNDYRRVMAHWESVLETPIHTVVYEKMVADQAGESRRLIDFVGLEWDDACERFYERKRVVGTASEFQVDQPIYTRSLRRYEKYADHIGPLREVIEDRYIEGHPG